MIFLISFYDLINPFDSITILNQKINTNFIYKNIHINTCFFFSNDF